MDPHPKSQTRTNISHRTIKLTHTDPVKRLKEFCKQGKYYHQIKWDKYANGFMFECEVTYNLGRNKRKVLAKEVRWIETDNLTEGQRVIAAILLDRLGLGVAEEEEEENENLEHTKYDNSDILKDEECQFPSQDFTKASMEAVTGVLNHVCQQMDSNDGDKDPFLGMAGNFLKQMTTIISHENNREDNQCDSSSSSSWADMAQESAGKSWADMVQEKSESKTWASVATNLNQ